MDHNRLLHAAALTAACASVANAQIVSDDFDTDTSASYIVASTGDAFATFLFDYSSMGIPPAPNTTGGTTLGVKFEANITAGAANAVTLHTVQTYTGDRVIRFDAWVNANGPFPGGGTGSTEFITCGAGGDGSTPNIGGSGTGAWFAATGEGGSSRDYRGYKDGSEQFAESGQFFAGSSSAGGGAHNASDPYYAQFGSIDVGALPVQGAAAAGGFPQQTGISQPGSFGFEWHEVEIVIDVDGGTGGAPLVTWSVDGLAIAALDAGIGAPFASDGSVTVGYMDIFSSISDNAALSFGLIDNLRIGTAGASSIYGTNPPHPAFGTANLVPVTDPSIGDVGAFDLSYAASGAEPGLLVIGTTPLALPFLGATALVSPPLLDVNFVTSPPTTSFSFPIPNNTNLVGAQLFLQAVVVDVVNPMTASGLVFSDGLDWTIGF